MTAAVSPFKCGPKPKRRDWRKLVAANKWDKLTRAERAMAFVELNCIVPEGQLVGQPIRLIKMQEDFFYSVFDNPHGTRRGYLSIARKNSKALSLETIIPTTDGWKLMRDIAVGDYVFGTSGNPVLVTATSAVFENKRCFKVGFSDGSEIVASEDHVWTTTHKYRPWAAPATYANGRLRGKNGHNRGRVTDDVTTLDISQSVRIKRTDGGVEYNHSVPVAAPLITSNIDLPIDPYVLGYWLGNGTSADGTFTASVEDASNIVKQITKSHKTAHIRKNKNRAPTIATSHDPDNSLRLKLKATGLLGNKHIPEIYFEAGTAQRWSLLQGLMDSDGTISKHVGKTPPQCSFTNMNEDIAYGVWRLARSLGLKATITTGEAKIGDKSYGICWTVAFHATITDPIFRLERKQTRLPVKLGKRSGTLKITSCIETESAPCKCIAVASDDHLYLAGYGCIPTHNTATIACILLVFLVGPEATQNSQISSGARSREQAAQVFNYAEKMVMQSEALSKRVRIIPSGKTLIGIPLNVTYKAGSAEAKTAMGGSPVLAILDEVGQVKGPQDDFIDAIITSQGAHENPLLLAISTQAAEDADLLSIWLDDAEKSQSVHIVSHVYTAPKDCDVLDKKAWKAANPALGIFRSLKDLEEQANDASRMPSAENTFRNLCLNQRVSTISPFISQSVWKANGGKVHEFGKAKVWVGLDLSGRADLTALIIIGKVLDVWQVEAHFWTPEVGLKERSKRDRVDYELWVRQGYLHTTPGKSVDYEFVAHDMDDILNGMNVQAVAYDRWRIELLRKELERANITLPLVEFGQGFKDMSPALDTLENELLNSRINHGMHPVLTMCAANAVVSKDAAGNRKLDKSKATGRIDGMVALAMAIGASSGKVEQKPTYKLLFV